MLEKVMQKGWKSGPKWSQNGVQNRLKINHKINQQIMRKRMPFGSVFSTFFVNGKSPKLPTIQQDYLQVVYLNITYLNKNQTIWETTD